MEQQYIGFWNRILRLNLTDQSWSVEEPGPAVYRRYMGGRTLALYYLLRETPAGVDPLGPENKLIFSAGVITGVPCGGCG